MTGQTPLTSKALERLRGIASGNGIDPAAIKIIKTDEADYTINAELGMTGRWELELAKPAELKQFQPRDVASTESLHSMANARPFPDRWWEAVLDELKATNVGNGTGWGADALTIALPALTELYVVNEVCRACAGGKYVDCSTCEGSGQEWCWHCNNHSGVEPANPQQRCSVCQGEQKAECRTCFGKRKVGCLTCKGRGNKQTNYALRFTASTRFNWVGGSDLPTALRRSVDRAGLAKLANGHATITQTPATEDKPTNPLAPQLRFTATLPFASATFDIAGRPFTAELLGQRTAILEMKPFLDQIAANALGEAKLNQLRLFKEAQAVAARRGTVADFIRGYPVGLSREMAEKVFAIARNSLNELLVKPRQQALVIALMVSAVLSALYFHTPLGTLIASFGLASSKILDLSFPLLLAIIFLFVFQWWTGKKLAARLGGQAQPALFNRIALLGFVLIFAVHIGIFFTQTQMPMWYLYDKLGAEVWLQNLGREQ